MVCAAKNIVGNEEEKAKKLLENQPCEEKELSSISGVELNPQLSNIYRAGIYARDSDFHLLTMHS